MATHSLQNRQGICRMTGPCRHKATQHTYNQLDAMMADNKKYKLNQPTPSNSDFSRVVDQQIKQRTMDEIAQCMARSRKQSNPDFSRIVDQFLDQQSK